MKENQTDDEEICSLNDEAEIGIERFIKPKRKKKSKCNLAGIENESILLSLPSSGSATITKVIKYADGFTAFIRLPYLKGRYHIIAGKLPIRIVTWPIPQTNF